MNRTPSISSVDDIYRVCAVSYVTEWWSKCPKEGSVSFSTDNGASFTWKADFTGTFSGALVVNLLKFHLCKHRNTWDHVML